MRVLVTGSRHWTDRDAVESALAEVTANVEPDEVVIVTGACPTGADAIAERVAKARGWRVERHPADWSLGRKAGPLRNVRMVRLGADHCVAFLPTNFEAVGTLGAVRAAGRAGIPVTRVLRQVDLTAGRRPPRVGL